MTTIVGTEGYKTIRSTFNMYADSLDVWGDAMEWWFSVAEVMYHNDVEIPGDWEFRDSPMHDGDYLDDTGNAVESELYDLYRNGEATEDDFLTFGTVLTRWANLLRAAGKEY
jgi:hypothetical protein